MQFGVLALQGDFSAHVMVLKRCGVSTVLIKKASQLAEVDALVIPGGESSAMLLLMAQQALDAAIIDFARSGKPILGTCAGAILLASEVEPAQASLGLINMRVSRNAFGRQIHSFTEMMQTNRFPFVKEPIEMIFIRAPRIKSTGKQVDVLLSWKEEAVMVRQEHIFAVTFHPELAQQDHIHQYFVDYVRSHATEKRGQNVA